jgi:lambda repressor-like predicted transcriptional regulator
MTPIDTTDYRKASAILNALEECSPELRAEAVELLKDLNSGELDPIAETATMTLLSEILFPNTDDEGLYGLDRLAPSQDPEAEAILEEVDRVEADFASRVLECMNAAGMTQSDLAKRLGIGQPAISMMLQRSCRPQKRTIRRMAEALGVRAQDLWPTIDD